MHVRRASLWVPFPFSADKIITENICVASKKADGVEHKIWCQVGNGDHSAVPSLMHGMASVRLMLSGEGKKSLEGHTLKKQSLCSSL